MKRVLTAKAAILVLLVAGLVAAVGCDTARGGVEIWLDDVSTGAVSMKGKPITGLPSGKVSLVLKVSAKRVNISTTGQETTIELNPSGGIIVIGPDGMSITGVESDQIEMKWQSTE